MSYLLNLADVFVCAKELCITNGSRLTVELNKALGIISSVSGKNTPGGEYSPVGRERSERTPLNKLVFENGLNARAKRAHHLISKTTKNSIQKTANRMPNTRMLTMRHLPKFYCDKKKRGGMSDTPLQRVLGLEKNMHNCFRKKPKNVLKSFTYSIAKLNKSYRKKWR